MERRRFGVAKNRRVLKASLDWRSRQERLDALPGDSREQIQDRKLNRAPGSRVRIDDGLSSRNPGLERGQVRDGLTKRRLVGGYERPGIEV